MQLTFHLALRLRALQANLALPMLMQIDPEKAPRSAPAGCARTRAHSRARTRSAGTHARIRLQTDTQTVGQVRATPAHGLAVRWHLEVRHDG